MKISSLAKYFFLRVINTEAYRKVLILVVAVILSLPAVMAQDGDVRPSKTEAQVAWDRGNYELAYKHFNGLLLLYSRDPLYKYYTGACLVKMERDISRAVTLLGSAINSSVNLKSVPDDVWFFYGRSLQMDGIFDQATEAYKRFAREAGRKAALEYEVQKFTDQCSLRQGVLSKSSSSIATAGENDASAPEMADRSATQLHSEASQQTQRQIPAVNSIPQSGKPEVPVSSASEMADNGTNQPRPTEEQATAVPVKDLPAVRGAVNEVPDDYINLLGEAVQVQHEADSLGVIAANTVTEAGAALTDKKEEMDGRAAYLSGRAAESQDQADSLFRILENHRNPVPEQPSANHEEPTPDYLLYRFEVRPAPAYSDKEPVPIDIDMPAGLIYSIQIAAFRNMVSPSLFSGLYPVYGRIRKESGTTYFYTGLFRRLTDARQALPAARSAGFPDAFIIAMMDGTQVSLERAAMLEKEWAAKPLPGQEQVTAEKRDKGLSEQVPVETLSFRAEVMRISKPVKPEVVEKLELLAGYRGLDMIKNSKGETVILIGNFITFESANDYVSLLIRNGYSAARVAAYVGIQEIPVEAARELLNKLPDD